jgi:haloalkane dehalogenase
MLKLRRRDVLAATAAFIALSGCTGAGPKSAGSAWRDRKRYIDVFGQRMAYYEAGAGRPIVFLHGNPMSSYLWRKIVPYVQDRGRCIAPDLIGMGDSAKLPNSGPGVYTYRTHRRYLFELFRLLGVERDVVLVIHDWGSVFGFDYAAQHPGNIRGIAYMEAFMAGPRQQWRPNAGRGFKERFKSSEGERAILENIEYIEHVISGNRRYLTEADIAEYRRPFLEPGESRRPMLEFTQSQSPGTSRETFDIIRAYCAWLARSTRVPKLFVRAVPGALMSPRIQQFALSLPNQKVVEVSGPHFIQEAAPDEVGQALAGWLAELP